MSARIGGIYYTQAGNYISKDNKRNTRVRCKIYSKLTKKTPERRQWCRSGVFIVNFEHLSYLFLLFLLLTLSSLMPAGKKAKVTYSHYHSHFKSRSDYKCLEDIYCINVTVFEKSFTLSGNKLNSKLIV